MRLNKQVELLDTPGILWPKFEDPEAGLHLAMIGSVKDEVLNTEELALELLHFLREEYPGVLAQRYGILETEEAFPMLLEIAKNRGCLLKGQELDLGKAVGILLEEFRSGKLGRFTLEVPGEMKR